MASTTLSESSLSMSKAVENRFTDLDSDHSVGRHYIFQVQCQGQNIKKTSEIMKTNTSDATHILPLKFHPQPIFVRMLDKTGTYSEQ
jgi:hypothetical protein